MTPWLHEILRSIFLKVQTIWWMDIVSIRFVDSDIIYTLWLHLRIIISSSSIYRGELSFLQLVHFCICWCDSAILKGYLFQQWLACVHVPNWKNVLRVRCVW